MLDTLSGKVDILVDYDPTRATLLKARGGHITSFNKASTSFIALNSGKISQNVRKAISLAFNREELVERLMHEQDGKVLAPVYSFAASSAATGWERIKPDWAALSDEARMERARQLMREAGYGPDNRLQLTMNYVQNNRLQERGAAATKDFLYPIWIDIEERPILLSGYFKTLRKGDYDLARTSWFADFDDPVNFYGILISSTKNHIYWNSSEFDALFKAARESRDPEHRLQLFREAEELIFDEAPIIPILSMLNMTYFRPGLKPVKSNIWGLISMHHVKPK